MSQTHKSTKGVAVTGRVQGETETPSGTACCRAEECGGS